MATFDKWQDPAGGTALSSPPHLTPAESPAPHIFHEGDFGEAADLESFTVAVEAGPDSIAELKETGVVHEVSVKPTAAIKGDETPVKIKVTHTRGEDTIGHVEHTVSTHVAAKAKVVIGGPFDVKAKDVLAYTEGPAGDVHVEYGA